MPAAGALQHYSGVVTWLRVGARAVAGQGVVACVRLGCPGEGSCSRPAPPGWVPRPIGVGWGLRMAPQSFEEAAAGPLSWGRGGIWWGAWLPKRHATGR